MVLQGAPRAAASFVRCGRGVASAARGVRSTIPAVPLPAVSVPEGWPAGPRRRFECMPAPTLLQRATDDKLLSLLLYSLQVPRAASEHDFEDEDDSPVEAAKPLVLLDGPRGVGKSAAMLRAVSDARRKGVVTMYIPSAREWTHGGGFFSAMPVEGSDPIMDGPEFIRYYDRPTQTLNLLSGMLAVHEEALAQIPLAIHSPLRDDNTSLATVRDVVSFGVDALVNVDADWRTAPRLGADALAHVIRELSAQSSFPVMFAIDDYEAFLGLTALVSGNKRFLHAGGIRAVADHFGRSALPSTAASLQRGVVLLALSESHGSRTCRPSRLQGTVDYPVTSDVRNDPTGRSWLAFMRRSVAAPDDWASQPDGVSDDIGFGHGDWKLNPTAASAVEVAASTRIVDVPEWTPTESADIVADFEERNLVPDMPHHDRDRMLMLAGGRADLLHKMCQAA
jgi:Mitochondrial ribosomal death-associated protein 3